MASGWSIRTQLSALVLAVMLPVMGVAAYGIIDARRESLERAYHEVRVLAARTADDLEAILRDNEAVIGRLAERPLIRALDPTRCDPIIADYVGLHPDYTQFGVRDAQGKLICSLRPISTMQLQAGEAAWFKEGMRSGRFNVGGALLGKPSGRWVSVLTYPIRDDAGKISGLLILPLDLLKLNQRLLGSVPPDALVGVLDREGNVVLRSVDYDKWAGKFGRSPHVSDEFRRQVEGSIRVRGADGVLREIGRAHV